MARVLRRPMFRLGGNTDQGIMSGVAPRQGYANGDLIRGAQERQKLLSAMAGRPSDRSASDFWVDWGLGMVSGTPRGNIFATAAEQAKEHLQRFRETKAAEKGFQRQLGMVAAEAEMSYRDKMALMTEEQKNKMAQIALENMSKSDLTQLQKQARVAWNDGKGINPDTKEPWTSYEEAEQWYVVEEQMKRFSKEGRYSPEVKAERAAEERLDDIKRIAEKYGEGLMGDNPVVATNKATFFVDYETIKKNNPDLAFDLVDQDSPFIDLTGKRTTYETGAVYFNPVYGTYHRYDGPDADPQFVDITDTIVF